MPELKISTERTTQDLTGKTVTIFFDPHLITLGGDWTWDFASEFIFCSNVMVALPENFEGTKGIIHPDDVDQLQKQLASDRISHLQFRIISSYGEVRTIVGDSIEVRGRTQSLSAAELPLERLEKTNSERKELEHLLLFKDVHEKASRYTKTGIWWYNENTTETWYSAEVFRIYELAPFSLNAHLNTFLSFIHTEDRGIVEEFVNLSHKEKTPLHIEYRIETAGGEKYVQHISQWGYSSKGESIMSGMLKDITEEKNTEKELELVEEKNVFAKHQLLFDEDKHSLGHWTLNLVTRKFSFSNNYYYLFGLRAKSFVDITGIYEQVHPDDRAAYKSAIKKMILEHAAPEIEFRIYRGDGKLRYMSQKAKLVTEGAELAMIGTVEDVTVETLLKKKIKELSDADIIRNFAQGHAEEMAGAAGWVWNTVDNTIKWSENFYNLVGLKSSAKEITHKFFMSLVHPEDQQVFKDHMKLLLSQKLDNSFDFRMLQWGKTKYMKASFRMMKHEGDEFFIAIFRDVTKERLLEEELKQRVQLAEALSENILDRVLITDIHNTIKVWNHACEETYGMLKDEVLGRNFFDVFPKLKTEEEVSLFNRVLKGESIFIKANAAVMTRGFFDLRLMPLWDNEHKEINGIIHILHDVTYETELQRNLNERLHFIESLVDASVDRVVALDRFMNYLYWNKKAEDYYGISKENIIGKNILEVFPSFRNHPGYQEFRTVLKGETIFIPTSIDEQTAEYSETYLIPVKNDAGDVTAILWIVHDLQKQYDLQREKRKADEQIKEQANYITRITETVPDMISVTELQTMNFTFLNKQRFAAAGFDFEEGKLQEELKGLVHPDDAPLLAEYFRKLSVADDADVVQAEYRAKNRHGQLQWFHVRGRVFQRNAEGTVTHVLNVIANNTERKKTEEDMQKNLTLLRYTEYLAQSGSWEYEIESGKFNWSSGMYKLFGLPKEMQVQPEIYLDASVEEDRAVAKKIVSSLKRSHDPFEEVMRIKRGDETRTIKIKSSVIHDADGRAHKIIGVDFDITNLVKAEEQLKESRHWLEQTAKASPDSITIYDLQRKQPVYLNNCLAEWLELNEHELLAMGIEGRLQIIHPDDRLKLLHHNEMVALAKDGEVITTQYRLRKKDGTTMWIRNRAKVFLRDASGKVTHLLSILQDVSEEAKLQEELKQRTSFAETVLDASMNRITVFDRDYRFVAWNKRSEQVLGLSKEKVLGKTIFEIFPGIEQHHVFIDAQKKALNGKYVHVPAVQDGYTGAYLELFYVPLKNETGETYAVLNIMHDVSNYVRNTEALDRLNKQLEAKNAELEQKNEEITSFAFVASHDMKEPLRKIHTFSDWLVQQETQQLSEKGKNLIEKINSAVHRMEVLIEDILVLTRIHSDHHRDEEVDLNQVVAMVAKDLKEPIEKTQAEIKAEGLPKVKGNSNQLFYLFKNLVSNAIKFQKPGNVPRVHISAEMVSAEEAGLPDSFEAYGKIAVRDNGFGFDKRYAKKIFQVFQRLHGKHEFEGTGIGLAICKKIMENHEGLITVDSEVGDGSTFICYFPLR